MPGAFTVVTLQIQSRPAWAQGLGVAGAQATPAQQVALALALALAKSVEVVALALLLLRRVRREWEVLRRGRVCSNSSSNKGARRSITRLINQHAEPET